MLRAVSSTRVLVVSAPCQGSPANNDIDRALNKLRKNKPIEAYCEIARVAPKLLGELQKSLMLRTAKLGAAATDLHRAAKTTRGAAANALKAVLPDSLLKNNPHATVEIHHDDSPDGPHSAQRDRCSRRREAAAGRGARDRRRGRLHEARRAHALR